jgi:hypothetical protein
VVCFLLQVLPARQPAGRSLLDDEPCICASAHTGPASHFAFTYCMHAVMGCLALHLRFGFLHSASPPPHNPPTHTTLCPPTFSGSSKSKLIPVAPVLTISTNVFCTCNQKCSILHPQAPTAQAATSERSQSQSIAADLGRRLLAYPNMPLRPTPPAIYN